jgi:hypothetical protein
MMWNATKQLFAWIASVFTGKKGKAVKLIINRVSSNGAILQGDITMLILTNTQEVDLAIKPVDAKGNPAQVDGKPAWLSTDATKVTVVPSADGLSCVVKAANNGSAQVKVTADADLGTGVRTLTGLLDVQVVSGGAVSIGIVTGTPREQV